MSIVLNEYEWAERMIGNQDLGKKPIETLNRISKYYYANQFSKRDIRRKLDTFLVQCNPDSSLMQWSDTLDRIVKNVNKYPLIIIDHIPITVSEMERINSLGGRQIRRLAFTLLCVAKYWDEVSKDNNHWVNSQDREIMNMANINTSIKRQSMMFSELREEGLIRFAKKVDSLNVQVLFIEDGETVLHIQDYRNLGYQYLRFLGEPYFECSNCGIVMKEQEPNRGRRQKYCPSCAAEVRTRQNVNAVMRRRNALQS